MPAVGSSTIGSGVTDVGRSLLVEAFASVLALTLALWSRAAITTVLGCVAVYLLPLTVLDSKIFWVTPTRWIVEWLHLDPFGEGVDYIGDNSPYDRWGTPAVAGGLLPITGVVLLCALNVGLLTRALNRPAERE